MGQPDLTRTRPDHVMGRAWANIFLPETRSDPKDDQVYRIVPVLASWPHPLIHHLSSLSYYL